MIGLLLTHLAIAEMCLNFLDYLESLCVANVGLVAVVHGPTLNALQPPTPVGLGLRYAMSEQWVENKIQR